MTSILHKVKDAVTSDKHQKPSHSTNAGPHDSNIANKLDPRVDSDRGTLLSCSDHRSDTDRVDR